MARRRHSPLVAAVLSGLLPGLGQWYVGRRRRAAVMLTISIVAAVPFTIVLVLLYLGDGPGFALDLIRPFFDRPEYLFVLLAVNCAVLVYRLLAAVDAFWLAGGAFTRRWLVAIGLTVSLVAVLVVAPHLWAGRRNLALYDLLSYDYSVDPNQVVVAFESPTPTTALPPPATPPEVDIQSETTTTTTTIEVPMSERRINILLLGGDAGPDRVGLRTDTMIVVSVDPLTGAAAMLQLPRNQIDLPIPEGHPAYDAFDCHCYPRLANTIYQYGLDHPDLFPGGANSGARALMDLIGHLYGMEIHSYALVDLLGFVDVVDALGGLTITVTTGVYDELYTRPGGEVVPVSYEPGSYEMDGEEVLAFARVRRGASDYTRMGRQRCVLEAFAGQSSPFTLLRALPYLVPALQESILTDIPVSSWPDYIELAGTVDTASTISIRFMPNAPELTGTGSSYVIRNNEGYWIPDIDFIRATVSTVISTDPATASEVLGIEPLGEVCR